MKIYAFITRAADKSYEGHIALHAPIGAHQKFESYTAAATWLAEELEGKTAGLAARRDYASKTAASVDSKNAEKFHWAHKLAGNNGHFLPLVILDGHGKVVRGGINRDKMARWCSEQNGDGGEFRIARADTGEILGGDADILLSLSEVAEIVGTSRDYLRQLIHRGKLDARKVGRDWVTTENAARKVLR